MTFWRLLLVGHPDTTGIGGPQLEQCVWLTVDLRAPAVFLLWNDILKG